MDTSVEAPAKEGRIRRVLRFGRARWWRFIYLAVIAYLGLFLFVQVATLAGITTARLLGKDPQTNDVSLPGVPHLRRADAQLWVGGQPSSAEYEGLADQLGIEVVVDLRTGGPADPTLDDPDFLADLGIDYVWLPIHDGHTPDPHEVKLFIEIVANSPGPVFMHCGGGVGRSSSLESAYIASQGREPSLLRQVALGPLSLEQAWYIFSAEPGPPEGANRFIEVASRAIDYPRPLFSWVRRSFF